MSARSCRDADDLSDAVAVRPPALSECANGFEVFLSTIQCAPVLSRDAEIELSDRFRGTGERGAASQLVLANLRHVVPIARGYLGYGLPLSDLVQEGSIGLMKAVKHFDPAAGARLMSFAVHWIRAEITGYIVRNWRLVKIATTKAQRKLFFKLRSLKKTTGWINSEEARRIAKKLQVSVKDVLQMDARITGPDRALDAPIGDERGTTVIDLMPADDDPVRELVESEVYRRDIGRLREALPRLDPRSRDILQRRWLSEGAPAPLSELAQRHGVSMERIRQIQNRALLELRKCIQEAQA